MSTATTSPHPTWCDETTAHHILHMRTVGEVSVTADEPDAVSVDASGQEHLSYPRVEVQVCANTEPSEGQTLILEIESRYADLGLSLKPSEARQLIQHIKAGLRLLNDATQ